jgi:hypothetical protein
MARTASLNLGPKGLLRTLLDGVVIGSTIRRKAAAR